MTSTMKMRGLVPGAKARVGWRPIAGLKPRSSTQLLSETASTEATLAGVDGGF
jgi:hypothetical protein